MKKDMKNFYPILVLLFLWIYPAQSQFFLGQNKSNAEKVYKGERTKINNLIHTKLKVRFHLKNHTMEGEAFIKLRPHFYPTDSLTLDAKFMQIFQVKVNGKPADYTYDKKKLKIRLPRKFTRFETYNVYVKYLAQPDSVTTPGGTAISDHKGLYFINTRNETNEYPPHLWTQGEPEANSVWFPTIDSPNQKSTQEIEMTIPADWVSLSNGKLVASRLNNDGTKTDTWKMELPHAPYLFFMAAGPFVIVKDSLENLPVNYYVEKKYKDVARDIFGKTPEMIRYYENLLGIEYPWDKYDQIVVRNFVSGAMENTTAVNHSEMAYQRKENLVDENTWESVVAHELFHHWFGDLVTAESWAQIAMNEAFADYGESLWEEHDEGMDKADYLRERNKQLYFRFPGANKKDLVRYYYHRPDDVFDIVSYQKGGLILHMLRHYVGDSAFFQGLRLYLERNRFKTGEAAQLRLALEEISGKDLKRFFDQWFYGSGHPKLKISYEYDDRKGKATVSITQKTKKIWEFPLQIDVYENGKRKEYRVTVNDSIEKFEFPYQKRPDLINVDAKHILLAEIEDTRPEETYYFQFKHARNYVDRKMGLDMAIKNKNRPEAFEIIVAALDDPFYKIREKALKSIDVQSPFFNRKLEKKIYYLAREDSNNFVKAAAIRKLSELKKKKYLPLFKKAVQSPSYAIKSAAFSAILKTDKNSISEIITPELEESMRFELIKFYVDEKKSDKMVFVASHLFSDPIKLFQSQDNQKLLEDATRWISSSNHLKANKILADEIYKLAVRYEKYGLKNFMRLMLQQFVFNQEENPGNNKNEIVKYYKLTIDKLK